MNRGRESTEISSGLARHLRSRSWIGRFPIASFLLSLVLVIVSFPFMEQYHNGDLIQGVLLTAMLLLALPALGGRRKNLALGIPLVTAALAGKWLNQLRPDLVPPEVFLVPGLLFFAYIFLHLLQFVLRSPQVDSEVLSASVAGYLLLGLLWAFAYLLVARLVPDAFVFSAGPTAGNTMKGFTAIYFSFVTLTTVGYGDIVPASGAARMLAMMEAMIGTFYMAMLVARLVAVYSSRSSEIQQPEARLK